MRTWAQCAEEFNRRNAKPITKSGAFMLHQSAIDKLRKALGIEPTDRRVSARLASVMNFLGIEREGRR